jgi:hypothetical protein
MIFCELTLAIYKPPIGEEQVVQEESYNEEYEFVWGLRLPKVLKNMI